MELNQVLRPPPPTRYFNPRSTYDNDQQIYVDFKLIFLRFPRYAVVTGANRGIGFETVRQLATAGATVVLTARNEKRGVEAINQLHESGLSNVLFHQLDVQDAQSIQSLADFIHTRFQRLDILVSSLFNKFSFFQIITW